MGRNYQTDNVREIQEYLRRLGYHDARIPPVPIDGIYDDATREAVTVFQQINRLEPTGVVDMETYDLLYTQYTRNAARGAVPVQPILFPYADGEFEVGIGDGGIVPQVVNHMLNEISVSYTGIMIPDETLKSGLFTDATRTAVISFQNTVGLEPSGKVDHATWNALATQYNSRAHTGE